MSQPSLFDKLGEVNAAFDIFRPLARRTDPETSQEAAGRVDGVTLAARVLEELKAGGPGTAHELADRLKLSLVTVSPRLRPLCVKGVVREAGKRDGRTVWAAI